MANRRFPQSGDKVKIVNCKASKANEGKEFIVKAGPYIIDRKAVVLLKGKVRKDEVIWAKYLKWIVYTIQIMRCLIKS